MATGRDEMSSPSFHPLPIRVSASWPGLKASRPSARRTSVVVPTHDDEGELMRTLGSLDLMDPRPREIIVVDDGSTTRVSEDLINQRRHGTKRRLIRHGVCKGAAAARNSGWRAASGEWILFTDAGCAISAGALAKYWAAWEQDKRLPIALAGGIVGQGGRIARYMTEQANLIPPFADGRPATIVTANALVFRQALIAIDGFDESFPSAGGEDYDLGLRLREIGAIGWAPEALVLHWFPDDLNDFVSRFRRYGRGMRLLAEKWNTSLRPHSFDPLSADLSDLAELQVSAMSDGYASPLSERIHPVSGKGTRTVP